MSDRAPYSRVYWTIRADDRLATVYPDDHHLATWLRLLLAADMAWPAPADLPASVKRTSLTALEAAGVIELLPAGLFRFHGLDSERGRRRDAAASSAGRRWDANASQTQSERDANASQTGPKRNASRDETRQDETRQAETDTAPDPADVYWTATGRYPTDKTLAWIDDLAGRYGAEEVGRLIASEHGTGHAKDLLGRVTDALRAQARQLDRAEQADEQRRLAEKRARGVNVGLLLAYHNNGHHVAEANPDCPACRESAA